MKRTDCPVRTVLSWVVLFVLPVAMAPTAEAAALEAAPALLTAEFASMKGEPELEAAPQGLEPCSAPMYRQFDFWIGDWDVVAQPVNPSRPTAHNQISSTQGGCVILEEYDTPGGYTGVSISYYNSGDGKWYQTWMDNQGNPIIHSGRLRDGSMILIDEQDADSVARTTWSPREDGSVRQHWESSNDGGKTWSTVFDGIYTRRSRTSHPAS